MCKTRPRDEVEQFQVLQVDIPFTSRVLPINTVLQNYFSENSADAQMTVRVLVSVNQRALQEKKFL